MKNLLFTITFCFLFIANIFSQNEKNRKWSVEIGGVYSQLHHNLHIQNIGLDTSFLTHFVAFKPLPSVRIARTFAVHQAFSIDPFIGFAIIGNETNFMQIKRSENDFIILQNGFSFEHEKVYYFIPSLELGAFIKFPLNKFDLAFGIKGQQHLKLITNHYKMVVPEPLTPQNMNTIHFADVRLNELFIQRSMSTGVHFRYNFERLFISSDIWYGINNLLIDTNTSLVKSVFSSMYETNVRLMIGYRF